MWRRILTTSCVFASLLFLGAEQATAQISTPPIRLKAMVESTGGVYLGWEKISKDTVGVYSIFRASIEMGAISVGTVPDASQFKQIDSTTRTSYLDRPLVTQHSMMFAYFVSAKTKAGGVLKSNIVVVSVLGSINNDYVRITSKPVDVAKVDVEYRYKVEAVSSDSSATFRYSLTAAPAGMTIDSTGLVTWIPKEIGFVAVEIKVVSSKGGQAVQRFSVRVSGGDGIVEGTVVDTTGTPIGKVIVQLYRSDRNLFFDYKAITDERGHFTMEHVDAGNYFAHAEHPEYLPEWYDGALSINNAKSITVTANASTSITFTLDSRYKPTTLFTVEGTVVDTVRLAPVRGATVVFVGAEFALNSTKRLSLDASTMSNMRASFDTDISLDHRLDGNSRFVFKTNVDSLGHFTLRIPQGNYIAYAFAKGYVKIFHKDKTNLLEADIIRLSGALTLTFALPPIPAVALGEINGAVIDSVTGLGVKAHVIAYRERWLKADLWRVGKHYVTDTDSTGAYTFSEMLPGDYILMAVPAGNYPPSFYNASGNVTHRWSEASKVTVNGNEVVGIDIYVKAMARTASGYTSISGSVNATVKGGGKGIDGTIVLAIGAGGSIAGYGVTDETGAYTIAGLAPGSYTVTADNPGYSSSPGTTSSPTYTATGSPEPASNNIALDPMGTTAVESDPLVPSGYSLEQNYPNPFNPSTKIVFSLLRSQRVSLIIYNILGQKIASLIDRDMQAGTHNASWNGKDDSGALAPTGVYLYRIATSDFVATRKMTLLK